VTLDPQQKKKALLALDREYHLNKKKGEIKVVERGELSRESACLKSHRFQSQRKKKVKSRKGTLSLKRDKRS